MLVGMLKMVLERAGYEVHACYDGVQALYQASALQPNLIILDLMMPWASGDAVLGFLRSTESLKQTRVLVMSAHPDGERIARQLEANGYLQKPVDMRTFSHTVTEMLASQAGPA